MRLAIADPPYPPIFGVRYDDVVDPRGRVTMRSRATRWYGEGPRGQNDLPASDVHPEAAKWDQLSEHRRLLEVLCHEYDGWAIATTPDGLGAYHPLPIEARIMAWVKPTALPTPHARLRSMWEPVIVRVPPERRGRSVDQVKDVLNAPVDQVGFVGAKPHRWTHWVLDALGYDPATDTVDDLFPGSGSVAAAVAERDALHAADLERRHAHA